MISINTEQVFKELKSDFIEFHFISLLIDL